MASTRILIVEDERPAVDGLAERLHRFGYTVCAVVTSGQQALEKAAQLHPDLALIGLDLAGTPDGPDVADRIRKRFDIPVIYLTTGVVGDLLQRARMTDPFGYVLKPVDARQLHLNIETALGLHEKERECKEAENKLKETADELKEQSHLMRVMQTIFDSMSEGVIAVDANGDRLIFNSSAERIVGFKAERKKTPAQWAPGQWTKKYGFYFPDQATPIPTDKLALVRAMRGESTDEGETFIRNQSKPEGVYISVNGRPLMSDTGESSGGVVVIRDITKQKETEKKLEETIDELRRQTRLFQTIFNSMSEGVVAVDENGDELLYNPSAERLVGFRDVQDGTEQWTARHGFYFPDQVTVVPTHELALARAMRGESTDEREMFIRNQNKPEGAYISVNGRPILDDAGEPRGGVIVFRDITERARAEEALAQAFAQGRLEVVDTVLHNIGNAINSVTIGIGTLRERLMENRLIHRFSSLAEAVEAHQEDWIAYLQHDPQGQQVRPFLLALADDFVRQNERLLRTVERVSRQVHHIVDIVGTQRNFDNTRVARKDVNLRQAISGALRVLEESFVGRGIRPRVNYGNVPAKIRIQESQFHQMLVNLLKNAMEATDELRPSGRLGGRPRIEIRAYVRREFLVLDVVDNGIGIAQKNIRAIFAAGYTTKPGGSGLGLHSAANFVTGSGGKIQPLSAGIGQGATMRVMLRLDAISPTTHA